MTKGIPSDILLPLQWHLGNGQWSINVQDAWADYTGEGVLVGAFDSGVDYLHPDLLPNYRADLDYDYTDGDNDPIAVLSIDNLDNHGTPVLGIIGADDNGTGVVGVAFDSQLVAYRNVFGQSNTRVNYEDALGRAKDDLDILNNSWGYTNSFSDNFNSPSFAAIGQAIEDAASLGRDDLGTILVYSAGNSRSVSFGSDNSNLHNLRNTPYGITVAAIDEDGTTATANGEDFSSPGANILISAPGTNVATIDRQGAEGYVSDDYVSFGGTSASAPVISGVVALMLEANSQLGYRDVQDILALTARQNDPTNTSWQTNAAGLHFSHDFGFGLVDAKAAVRLAETWTEQRTFANLAQVSETSVTNATMEGGTFTFNLDITQDILIEHVIINVDYFSTSINDITIKLISPDGTQSVLLDRTTEVSPTLNIDFDFSSMAHRGESSLGEWTLSIQDTRFLSTDSSSILSDWGLTFLGRSQSADDVYVYTQERTPELITDSDGGIDTVNFAALSDDLTIDLSQNTPSTIGAQSLTFSPQTEIENVIAGDGNDILSGSSSDNFIRGGRGNDRLIYDVSLNAGSVNELDGDKGDDTLQLNFVMSEFVNAIFVELDNLLSFIGLNSDNNAINGAAFSFSNLALSVSDFEFLEVFVDGVLQTEIPSPNTPAIIGTQNNDTLNATVDADEFIGLGGNDTASYREAADAVTIDLASGINTGTYAAGDTYDSIENILGSTHDDTFIGGAGNDSFSGWWGDDTFYASAGNDFFVSGNNDADIFIFEAAYAFDGIDTIQFFNPDQDIIDISDVITLYDPASHALSDFVQFTDNGRHGFLEVDADGTANGVNFTRIAQLNWNTVLDAAAMEASGNLITDNGVPSTNVAPIAQDDNFIGEQDTDVTGNVLNDNGNGADSDANGDTLNVVSGVFATAQGGSVVLSANGDFTYTPALEFFGSDNFDYTLEDGQGGVDTATVSLTVHQDSIVINGTAASETLEGTSATETINGFGGNDIIRGRGGDDIIYGGTGNDDIRGANNSDDIMYGEDGNDSIRGYGGDDQIFGGEDNDSSLWGYAGNDLIDGGAGVDTARYTADISGINIDLANQTATDGWGDTDTLISIENIHGSSHDDVMIGSSANNQLRGYDGNDTLKGGDGSDQLRGYDNDDILYGEDGRDDLWGGAGADQFIFESISAFNDVDRIKDFDATDGDVIDVSDLLSGYDPLADAISDFVQITDNGTHSYIEVDSDGGSDSFQQIVRIDNTIGLGTADALELSGTLKTEIV